MNPLDAHRAHLAESLAALGTDGRRRATHLPAGIDLVSNDYLGLAEHPAVREAMRSALASGPVGSGGSRLLRGHHAAFDALEERLASFSGAEAALFFGSGYLANLGLLQAVVERDDLVLSDALNHASLIDGIRLSRARKVVFRHNDLADLECRLVASRPARTFIVTESVFSMDGDLAPLAEMAALAEAHGALLIVDEAHATGLFGKRGGGRVEALGLESRVLATVHTAGKALGSAGAWVAGSRLLRETLVNRARTFIYATAPPPALAAAVGAALELVAREPERRREVHRKAALLRARLAAAGLTAPGDSQIVPLIVGGNEPALALQAGLQALGFDVRAVRPPTVAPGTARLRVSVRYPVADTDLARFAREVGRLLRTPAA